MVWSRPKEEARLALSRMALAGLVLLTGGCARRIDVGRVRGPDQAAITIPYTGVREESRLYPDYNTIGAAILTEEPPKPGKKGK